MILFLSSAFFPRNLLLEPAKTIADWNPMSLIAEGLREPIISGLSLDATLEGARRHRDRRRRSASLLRAAALRERLQGRMTRRCAVELRDGLGADAARRSTRSCASRARRSPACSRRRSSCCGLTSVFGKLTLLPGFTTDDYMSSSCPVSFLQGAGFTGAATGVNLARDIELGWFDRLLASPRAARRAAGRHGAVGEPARADADHVADDRRLRVRRRTSRASAGSLIAVLLAAGFAAIAASLRLMLALRFKTQAARR